MLSQELIQKIASTDYTMNGGQYQIRSGRLFARVTSVLSAIKFDDGALDKWRKRLQIKAFSQQIDMHETYKGNKVFDAFSSALSAPDDFTFASAAFGTKVHVWLETFMKTGVFPELLSDEYANVGICSESVKKFLADTDISPTTVEVIKPELFVYSDKYGYAGSADFVCMRNGKVYLFDWKTSNGYREQYGLQLAAYAQAIEELYGLHVEKGTCVVFNKDKVGYETHTITDKQLAYNFELFKACLVMYNFIKKTSIPDTTIDLSRETPCK